MREVRSTLAQTFDTLSFMNHEQKTSQGNIAGVDRNLTYVYEL